MDYNCNSNIKDDQNEYNLVSYCIKNEKYQACEMLITLCKDKLDVIERNSDNSTLYGCACNKGNKKILKLLNDNFSSQIDYHSSQIYYNRKLLTPIYYFIRIYGKKDMKNNYD